MTKEKEGSEREKKKVDKRERVKGNEKRKM